MIIDTSTLRQEINRIVSEYNASHNNSYWPRFFGLSTGALRGINIAKILQDTQIGDQALHYLAIILLVLDSSSFTLAKQITDAMINGSASYVTTPRGRGRITNLTASSILAAPYMNETIQNQHKWLFTREGQRGTVSLYTLDKKALIKTAIERHTDDQKKGSQLRELIKRYWEYIDEPKEHFSPQPIEMAPLNSST